MTRWNASAAVPPWAVGSVSGPITFWNSTIEPGQPWVSTSGVASSCGERTCWKWMSSPSISTMWLGWALSPASHRRQS